MTVMGLRIPAFCALLLFAGPAFAQNQPSDWPCIQPLVPALSPAQVWPGPPVDEAAAHWRDHPEDIPADLKSIVRRAVSRSVPEADAAETVDSFAEKVAGGPDGALPLLFAGIFTELDGARRDTIAGIKRFARAQQDRLAQLQDMVGQLDAARSATPPDPARIAQLADEVAWQRRILDERQRSLRALCEQPAALEARLGVLARTIAAHLE
jgi:hypothetical protein